MKWAFNYQLRIKKIVFSIGFFQVFLDKVYIHLGIKNWIATLYTHLYSRMYEYYLLFYLWVSV